MNQNFVSLALLGLLATGAGFHSTPAHASAAAYRISDRMVLGEKTKWDYVAIDDVRHRLFVTRGDRVDVVDLASGKLMASITNTDGVHGVAFAEELKLGFTSNGKSNSVTVFDLDTLATTIEIPLTGKNPDAILYEPGVKKLYVFNGSSNDVDIIDAAKLKAVGNVKATGRPEFAVSDGHGRIYFNIEDNAGINVIDVASNQRIAAWKLDGCEEPTGLAIDVARGRLFSACRNGIMAVTNALTGQRVTQFAIGEHPDATVYDAASGTVLTSGGGGNGTLAIAHQDDADHYSVRASIATEKGARTMAIDANTKTVYLPTVASEKFVVLVATPEQH